MDSDYIAYKTIIEDIFDIVEESEENNNELLGIKLELLKRCAKCRIWCGLMNTCKNCEDSYHPKCEEIGDFCLKCVKEYNLIPGPKQIIESFDELVFPNELKLMRVKSDENRNTLIKIFDNLNIDFTDQLNYMVDESANNPDLTEYHTLSETNLKKYYELKEFTSNKHFNGLKISHNNQYGYHVIATENIPKNTLICEYTGGVFRYRTKMNDESNTYLFDLIKTNISSDCLCIDAKNYGNISRFINCSSEKANTSALIIRIKNELRILFITTKDIYANEQIFYDYGDKYNL
jgi:hypothetical protein